MGFLYVVAIGPGIVLGYVRHLDEETDVLESSVAITAAAGRRRHGRRDLTIVPTVFSYNRPYQ